MATEKNIKPISSNNKPAPSSAPQKDLSVKKESVASATLSSAESTSSEEVKSYVEQHKKVPGEKYQAQPTSDQNEEVDQQPVQTTSTSNSGLYQADPVNQRELEKLAKEEEDLDTNKKVGKLAAQGLATYFGGSAAGNAVSAINKSGIADPIYDDFAENLRMANRALPVSSRLAQKGLNALNKTKLLDAAQQGLDAAGSKGGAVAGETAKKVGSEVAGEVGKEAGGQAANQALKEKAKKEAQERAQQAAEQQQAVKQAEQQKQSLVERKEKREKAKAKRRLFKFLTSNPWIFVVIGGFIVVILILVLLYILLASTAEDDANNTYIDPNYDFSLTMVTITNSYTTEADKVTFERIELGTFLAGMAYAEVYPDVKDLNKEQQVEAYKSFMVAAKALVFNMGGYDSETKEVTIQSGSGGLPYCDIDNGCYVLRHNGATSYVSKAYGHLIQGEQIAEIDSLPLNEQTNIFLAYSLTKYEVVAPESLNDVLEKYNYGNVPYNPTVKQYWIDQSDKNKTYDYIVPKAEGYDDLKIYDLEDHATKFTYTESTSYWWPIGSKEADGGIYGGTPSCTYISSKYGPRTVEGQSGYHKGIDIACSNDVIIASKSGTVIAKNDGCPRGSYGSSCGGGYGNYVIIDHGDGTSTVYAHMLKDTVEVNVGDKVNQGQKLGLMGSSGSSTGNHLHFEVRINGEKVDPLQYVSAESPRPAGQVSIGYESGSSNMQSVCLTLKKSGFSNNAVIALMINMNAESSFRVDALGDNGTSYGLCQWHNGRYTNLKNYCGDKYSTVECQLSFLLYELQNSYKGVFNNLQSNNSARNMADYFCQNFERPYKYQTNCPIRADNNVARFTTYVNNGCQ